MLTPQQIQTLTLQARARGYDQATTERFLQFADSQFSSQVEATKPVEQKKEEPKKQGLGFLKEIVKDPVKTLLVKPAVRTAQAGIGLLGGQRGRAFAEQDINVNLPLLGDFNIEAQRGGLSGVKQIAGDAAKTASYLYTPGKVVGTLGKTVTTGQKILQSSKTAAIGSGLYSGGQAAIENKSLGEIAKETAIGAGTGAVIGAAIPAAVQGIKTLQKVDLSRAPRIEKPSIFQQKTLNQNLKTLDTFDKYGSIKRIASKSPEQFTEVKKMLAGTDLLFRSVDETGTIRTLQKDGAYDQVKDFLKPQESVISDLLKKEGKKVPLSEVAAKLKKSVNESGLKGGAKLRALKNVEDDIAGYALDADKDGLISLSTVQEAKIDKYSNINYLNPESKRADKAIAKGLKELVEESSELVRISEVNGELKKLYNLLDYLDALDGKKVEGGKLGKYFAQTIGGIVGSHFGPVGTIVGAELAGKIKGFQMASRFGKKTGGELKISPIIEDAIKKSKQ